ncbi:hypothetical protein FRC11_014269 [Ceratobasidium sp. 423]|nr:hypothetical protein FRC11_014269 [Ceratobasidium sp. 423]
MPKPTGVQRKHLKAPWGDNITQETFKGLNIHSIGLEPSIRNVPPPTGKPYDAKQKLERETLGKVENDMTRKLLKAVSEALNNQVRLPFRVSDFLKERKKGIPISSPGAFGTLTQQQTRLTMEKGPAVVTDEAGVPLVWYFPHFIGTGLHTNLMRCVTELARAYQPPPDDKTHDRRARAQKSEPCVGLASNAGYMTRSRMAGEDRSMEQDLNDNQQEQEISIDGFPCTMEEPIASTDEQPCPETYEELEGEVRLEGEHDLRPLISSEHPNTPSIPATPELSSYAPVAYYFSPGWSQTGMQYVRPIQMSLHFRNALDRGLDETIRLLEAKRLLDKQIALLTKIIQPSLSRSMEALRSHMSAVKGPTGTAVVNGWTSAFPCFGITINRVTPMHRDIKGISAGLDVIGVLGTFTEGGDLELPDLNLRLEWKPGCLGAFDGYDFRHMVHDWAGGSRVALISFCRKSTWDALKLSPKLTRPAVEDCQRELASAKKRRDITIEEAKRRLQTPTTEANNGGATKHRTLPPDVEDRPTHTTSRLTQSSLEGREENDNKRRKVGDVLP